MFSLALLSFLVGNREPAFIYFAQTINEYYKKGCYSEMQDINYLLLTPNNNNKGNIIPLVDNKVWEEITNKLERGKPNIDLLLESICSFFVFSCLYDTWLNYSKSNSPSSNNTNKNDSTSNDTPSETTPAIEKRNAIQTNRRGILLSTRALLICSN